MQKSKFFTRNFLKIYGPCFVMGNIKKTYYTLHGKFVILEANRWRG